MKLISQVDFTEAEEILRLPQYEINRKYRRPAVCGFDGALDKQFGCPFILDLLVRGESVLHKCKNCVCNRKNI